MQIYDRDGLTSEEFIKGDMYLCDLMNTKGHLLGLTCGEWHPKEKKTILTSSEDGSLIFGLLRSGVNGHVCY